jgi:hypothetical protein
VCQLLGKPPLEFIERCPAAQRDFLHTLEGEPRPFASLPYFRGPCARAHVRAGGFNGLPMGGWRGWRVGGWVGCLLALKWSMLWRGAAGPERK